MNRFKRRQQKRAAERAVQGKITSANRQIEFKPGARIPVKVVTPHTDRAGNYRQVEFYALLVVEDDCRTRLESLGDHELPRVGEPEYHATLEIEGYPDWQMISNIPVEISRHTQGVVYTKLATDSMKTWGVENRV